MAITIRGSDFARFGEFIAGRYGKRMDTREIEALKARVKKIEEILDDVSGSGSFIRDQGNDQDGRVQDFDLTILRDAVARQVWPTSPPLGGANHGWDSLVDPWIDLIPNIGDKIPSAYRIWLSARRYLVAGDLTRAKQAERLNYLLHNSHIPAGLKLRGEVTFGYGGIGVIVHEAADIYEYVTIGANVTIGGNGGAVRIDERTGTSTTVPEVRELCTVGAAANVTGGISIAPLTIIAPNAVVTKSTEPGDIVGGVPAKRIGKITEQNALRYKTKFLPARSWSDGEYLEYVIPKLF